jgi:hypothetical protein
MSLPSDPESIALAASFFGPFVADDLQRRGMPAHFSVRPEFVLEIYARLRSDYFGSANDLTRCGKIVSSEPLKCSKCRGTLVPGEPVFTRDSEWKLQWCGDCYKAALEHQERQQAKAAAAEVLRRRAMAERHASRIAGRRAAKAELLVNPNQLALPVKP